MKVPVTKTLPCTASYTDGESPMQTEGHVFVFAGSTRDLSEGSFDLENWLKRKTLVRGYMDLTYVCLKVMLTLSMHSTSLAFGEVTRKVWHYDSAFPSPTTSFLLVLHSNAQMTEAEFAADCTRCGMVSGLSVSSWMK